MTQNDSDPLPADVLAAICWSFMAVLAGFVAQWIFDPRIHGEDYGALEILGFVIAALPWFGVAWRRLPR